MSSSFGSRRQDSACRSGPHVVSVREASSTVGACHHACLSLRVATVTELKVYMQVSMPDMSLVPDLMLHNHGIACVMALF